MLETDPPDVLVPVDYPGFNLRAARAARKRGVRVVYYISPQLWAWAPWRIRKIARAVDEMLVILPFERPLYTRAGVASRYVGHPLIEHLERETPAREDTDKRRTPRRIGLLPGSRRAEVRGLLPSMLRAARRLVEDHPDLTFVLPFHRDSLRPEIERVLDRNGAGLTVDVVAGRTHEVMRDLDLAMVASGTATLELTYYGVPMVVMYRVGHAASLFRRILLIPEDIALVNIVAGRRIVPEIVAPGDLSIEATARLAAWLDDDEARREVQDRLRETRERLFVTGVSDRAAGFVLSVSDGPPEVGPHRSPPDPAGRP
jgi:lipid-A-disaccharide synthase